ncbi:MAG: aspartate aminotransferase family protein [Christensenellaceae bacterium]|nr:aspartate aminotransferase family protein [Christensenellaceae bacterium]
MDAHEKNKLIDDEYVMQTFTTFPVTLVAGDGCTVWDSNGKKYVDFLAAIAVNSLGHKHPVLVDAVTKQLDKIVATSNHYYNEYRGKLAKKLVEGTNLKRVFFANSGAEANECAIKLARKYHYNKLKSEKFKIISAKNSFHGRTIGTVSLTGQPKYNEYCKPLVPGFGEYVEYNDIKALKTALDDPNAGALIIEPILGEGGIIPATKEYMEQCRKLTYERGQLLIIDEIQTGGGRTGALWAFTKYGIKPDIVTAAKGIGGGLPIGVCMATAEVASCFKPGDHGTTFGGSPLVCAASYAVISKILEPGFMESVVEKGEYLRCELNKIKHKGVVEVRGKGLMLGLQTNEYLKAPNLVKEMLNKGFLVNSCGNNVLRFLPPLIIEKHHIDDMIRALREIIEKE